MRRGPGPGPGTGQVYALKFLFVFLKMAALWAHPPFLRKNLPTFLPVPGVSLMFDPGVLKNTITVTFFFNEIMDG